MVMGALVVVVVMVTMVVMLILCTYMLTVKFA